jgi:hypothetical protein
VSFIYHDLLLNVAYDVPPTFKLNFYGLKIANGMRLTSLPLLNISAQVNSTVAYIPTIQVLSTTALDSFTFQFDVNGDGLLWLVLLRQDALTQLSGDFSFRLTVTQSKPQCITQSLTLTSSGCSVSTVLSPTILSYHPPPNEQFVCIADVYAAYTEMIKQGGVFWNESAIGNGANVTSNTTGFLQVANSSAYPIYSNGDTFVVGTTSVRYILADIASHQPWLSAVVCQFKVRMHDTTTVVSRFS